MKYISDSGFSTYYEENGDPNTTTILLLHGIGLDHRMWKNQMEPLTTAGFHVLALDLYGHGKSSKLERITLDNWNDQINNLMDHLKISKAIIIGVSMGGVIAQHFVIKHSSKVIKLIISDSFGELKTLKEKLLGASQVIGFGIFKLLGVKTFAKAMRSTYKAEFAASAGKEIYNRSLEADFKQLILARKAINKIDVIKDLSNINVQSLVIVGRSFGAYFIKINKKIANGLNDSRFIEMDNSMDPSPLVNPDQFNEAVLSFIF